MAPPLGGRGGSTFSARFLAGFPLLAKGKGDYCLLCLLSHEAPSNTSLCLYHTYRSGWAPWPLFLCPASPQNPKPS